MGARKVELNSIRRQALPSCTVIVCTRRRPQELRRCLESLRCLRYPEHSVLVVENDAASTESKAIALGNGAGYRLCTRRGLSAARNFGVRMSTSELLAFIDDDAVCEPEWLVAAVPLFASDRVLAVTGKIIFHEDSTLDSAPVSTFDPGYRIVGKETPDWFSMANFGGLGMGMNSIVRRGAFNIIGFFDERLGRGSFIFGGEDHDLLFRIIDAGFQVATCPGSIVRHHVENLGISKDTFKTVTASSAVFTMLAVEHPRHLPKLIRYVWEAVQRKPQPWRNRSPRLFHDVESRWIVWSALASGPFIYFWSALRAALSRNNRRCPAGG